MAARFTGIFILLIILLIVVMTSRLNRTEIMKKRCAEQNMAYDGDDYCREFTPEERAQNQKSEKNSTSNRIESFFKDHNGFYKVEVHNRHRRYYEPKEPGDPKILHIHSVPGKTNIELKGMEESSPTFWVRLDNESLHMQLGEALLDHFETFQSNLRSEAFANWKWNSSEKTDRTGPSISMKINQEVDTLRFEGTGLDYTTGSPDKRFSVTVDLSKKLEQEPERITKKEIAAPQRIEIPKRKIDPANPAKLLKPGKFEAGILGIEIVRTQVTPSSATRNKTKAKEARRRRRASYEEKLRLRMKRYVTTIPRPAQKPKRGQELRERRPTVLGTTQLVITPKADSIHFKVKGVEGAGFPNFKVALKKDGSALRFKKKSSKAARVIEFSQSWFGTWSGLCWELPKESKFCIGILEDDSFLVQLLEEDFSAVLNY